MFYTILQREWCGWQTQYTLREPFAAKNRQKQKATIEGRTKKKQENSKATFTCTHNTQNVEIGSACNKWFLYALQHFRISSFISRPPRLELCVRRYRLEGMYIHGWASSNIWSQENVTSILCWFASRSTRHLLSNVNWTCSMLHGLYGNIWKTNLTQVYDEIKSILCVDGMLIERHFNYFVCYWCRWCCCIRLSHYYHHSSVGKLSFSLTRNHKFPNCIPNMRKLAINNYNCSPASHSSIIERHIFFINNLI